MKNAAEIIFREITPADFFNINKPSGMEARGGGQSYIDIPIGDVDLATWRSFFDPLRPQNKTGGPLWTVNIHSLGRPDSQQIDIGQRRPASVSIRSQKLFSKDSKRVHAWHPETSRFPAAPKHASSAHDFSVIKAAEGVRIFIVKTGGKKPEYWAGWLKTQDAHHLAERDPRFLPMYEQTAGHIKLSPRVRFDEANPNSPFQLPPATPPPTPPPTSPPTSPSKQATASSSRAGARALARSGGTSAYAAKPKPTEEEIAKRLFDEDTASKRVPQRKAVREAYGRNKKAVQSLKRLYRTCQVTGDQFVFPKGDGEPYLEVHHLVPLGDGGADSPANLVVVSAHIHRMLHHADVEELDLSKIVDGKLDFKINGEIYTITWHPDHAKTIDR